MAHADRVYLQHIMDAITLPSRGLMNIYKALVRMVFIVIIWCRMGLFVS